MTGVRTRAIVMAKLRHCAKFRCTGGPDSERDFRMVDEGERGGEGPPVKKGVRKANDQTTQ